MDHSTGGPQQPRGFRKRVYQWAGRTVNQWLEQNLGQSPLSPPVHPTDGASTGPTRPSDGRSHGATSLPTTSDHCRLRFKVRDAPNFSASPSSAEYTVDNT